MTAKTKAKPKTPESLLARDDYATLSNREIRKITRDDEKKRYLVKIKAGAPVQTLSVCGVSISYVRTPIDPYTGKQQAVYGEILELSPRLVEVIKHRLEHQVATVRYMTDPEKKQVFDKARTTTQIEDFRERPSAKERIRKDPFIRDPRYQEPVGIREFMSDHIVIQESTAEAPGEALALKYENEEQREQILALKAKLAAREST